MLDTRAFAEPNYVLPNFGVITDTFSNDPPKEPMIAVLTKFVIGLPRQIESGQKPILFDKTSNRFRKDEVKERIIPRKGRDSWV